MDGKLLDGLPAWAARDLRNFEVAEAAVLFTSGGVAISPPYRLLEFRSKGSAVRDSRNSEAAEMPVQWLSGRQEHAFEMGLGTRGRPFPTPGGPCWFRDTD